MRRHRWSATWLPVVAMGLPLWCAPSAAVAQDGAYGRLDGDLAISAEVGISEALGEAPYRGEALAVRAGALYVHTVGLTLLYDEGLGVEALPLRRTLGGALELRPLFWGRFAEDMEQGPALLDLFVDSFSLQLGMFGAWPRRCGPGPRRDGCSDYGMLFGAGIELPLVARASAPFIGFRGGLRWSLDDRSYARDAPPVSGLLTLTIGYRHLFATHLVDAVDRLAPR